VDGNSKSDKGHAPNWLTFPPLSSHLLRGPTNSHCSSGWYRTNSTQPPTRPIPPKPTVKARGSHKSPDLPPPFQLVISLQPDTHTYTYTQRTPLWVTPPLTLEALALKCPFKG